MVFFSVFVFVVCFLFFVFCCLVLFGISIHLLIYLFFFFCLIVGKIPLRELVYRVHALPPSMRPLVWDFGQLSAEVEAKYIRQIVQRYVSVQEQNLNCKNGKTCNKLCTVLKYKNYGGSNSCALSDICHLQTLGWAVLYWHTYLRLDVIMPNHNWIYTSLNLQYISNFTRWCCLKLIVFKNVKCFDRNKFQIKVV